MTEKQRVDPLSLDISGEWSIPYTGIAAVTIKGKSLKLTCGGTASHLDNEAAEKYLGRGQGKTDAGAQRLKL